MPTFFHYGVPQILTAVSRHLADNTDSDGSERISGHHQLFAEGS